MPSKYLKPNLGASVLDALAVARKPAPVEMAERIGIDVKTVYRWRKAHAVPESSVRVAIFDAVGIVPDWWDVEGLDELGRDGERDRAKLMTLGLSMVDIDRLARANASAKAFSHRGHG